MAKAAATVTLRGQAYYIEADTPEELGEKIGAWLEQMQVPRNGYFSRVRPQVEEGATVSFDFHGEEPTDG